MSVLKSCDEYFAARAEYERVHAISSRLHEKMQSAKLAMIDAMLAEGMRSYTRSDGIGVSLRRSFNCSVTKDNMDDIREWLVDKFGDDQPYVKQVVDKPALTETLRTMVDEQGVDIDHFPEFLRVSTRPDLQVRGWKNRETEEQEEP